ncbi:hypothetical protein RHI9324_04348 [Rhizobium sp. CECT 9324]|nr:hypothetical protein RHI9324_04348 [Rhizobium sp. CECT 9324]
MVHIKTSLELVEKLSTENRDKSRSNAAHALREARVQAGQFVKTLRAILSDLRRNLKSLIESEDHRQKMETYFEDFIGELILKDFQAILTFNHPYRFRDQIVTAARRISYSPELLRIIAEGYFEIGIASDVQQARDKAVRDLLSIETTFDRIGEMFERIAQFRRAVETRLRNTFKHAEQGELGLSSRARELVGRLEALMAANSGRYAEPTVPASVEPVSLPWSQSQLAAQRQARLPISTRPLALRPHDPVKPRTTRSA